MTNFPHPEKGNNMYTEIEDTVLEQEAPFKVKDIAALHSVAWSRASAAVLLLKERGKVRLVSGRGKWATYERVKP